MLKCQLHIHVSGDPEDYISYSPQKLIKEAKRLNYNAISITCHQKVIFTKSIQNYAKKHGIILIPGIEIEIEKKHVIAINVSEDIEKIKTFNQLREYKSTHKNSIIIAPHPFFPGKSCLKKKLIENIDIFDAIENSFCYTTTKNYNKKAILIAKKYNKPIIATSDCHILKNLDLGYTMIDSKKNIQSIIKAIKQNKITPVHSPTSYFRIFESILVVFFKTLFLKRYHKS